MLCFPLKSLTTSEILKTFSKVKNQVDLIEIWLDQIKDLDLRKIIKFAPLPLIFVNKGKKEQGSFIGSEEKRIEILRQAIDAGADYVDVGLNTNPKLIRSLTGNKKKTKIIISFHDFQKTPSLKTLLKITQKAFSLGADIVKIAVYAQKTKDNLVVFDLIKKLVVQKKKIIGLAMGKYGKISRVFSPIFGSYLMYAPLKLSEKTADGQMTIRELKEIWRMVNSKY